MTYSLIVNADSLTINKDGKPILTVTGTGITVDGDSGAIEELFDLAHRAEADALDGALRDAHQVIAVLLRRLGGEVTVTDREIVEVKPAPTIQSFRSDDREGVVLRVL